MINLVGSASREGGGLSPLLHNTHLWWGSALLLWRLGIKLLQHFLPLKWLLKLLLLVFSLVYF